MRLNIPPVVPYAVGAMLVLFGSLRIKYLAAPRPAQSFGANGADDGVGDGPGESVRAGTEEAAPTQRKPVRRKEQKRHLKMGVLWILMGMFLLVSTYLEVRRARP